MRGGKRVTRRSRVTVRGGRRVTIRGGRRVTRRVAVRGGRRVVMRGGKRVTITGGRMVTRYKMVNGKRVSVRVRVGGRVVSGGKFFFNFC